MKPILPNTNFYYLTSPIRKIEATSVEIACLTKPNLVTNITVKKQKEGYNIRNLQIETLKKIKSKLFLAVYVGPVERL